MAIGNRRPATQGKKLGSRSNSLSRRSRAGPEPITADRAMTPEHALPLSVLVVEDLDDATQPTAELLAPCGHAVPRPRPPRMWYSPTSAFPTWTGGRWPNDFAIGRS